MSDDDGTNTGMIRCRLCTWTFRAVIDHSPAGQADAARVARHFIVRHPEVTTSPLGYFDVEE